MRFFGLIFKKNYCSTLKGNSLKACSCITREQHTPCHTISASGVKVWGYKLVDRLRKKKKKRFAKPVRTLWAQLAHAMTWQGQMCGCWVTSVSPPTNTTSHVQVVTLQRWRRFLTSAAPDCSRLQLFTSPHYPCTNWLQQLGFTNLLPAEAHSPVQ